MRQLILFLSIVLMGRTYSQNCLVAEYKLDGNAIDNVNSHHGTNNGTTNTTDRFDVPNHALSFDGKNDYITIQDDNDLEGFTEMTITTWINLPSYDYDGSAKVIIQKWGTGPVKDRCYLIAFDSLYNRIWFQVFLNNSSSTHIVELPLSLITLNSWHMVSAVYDNDSIHLYIDSDYKQSRDVPNGDKIQTGSADLTIGREQGTNDFTKILLDDLRVFNCGLTKSQIDSLFLLTNCDIDTTLTSSNGNLISNENDASYLWYDCINDTVLPVDTFQFFHPTTFGSYAVILSKDGCTDTSDCVELGNVGIEKNSKRFNVYPNPSNGILKIDISSPIDFIITVYNTVGKLAYSNKLTSNQIDLRYLNDGVYYVQLENTIGELMYFRVIINNRLR